ncbi:unnamed protein product, partial [Discosporangium mesarthrocarpum]
LVLGLCLFYNAQGFQLTSTSRWLHDSGRRASQSSDNSPTSVASPREHGNLSQGLGAEKTGWKDQSNIVREPFALNSTGVLLAAPLKELFVEPATYILYSAGRFAAQAVAGAVLPPVHEFVQSRTRVAAAVRAEQEEAAEAARARMEEKFLSPVREAQQVIQKVVAAPGEWIEGAKEVAEVIVKFPAKLERGANDLANAGQGMMEVANALPQRTQEAVDLLTRIPGRIDQGLNETARTLAGAKVAIESLHEETRKVVAAVEAAVQEFARVNQDLPARLPGLVEDAESRFKTGLHEAESVGASFGRELLEVATAKGVGLTEPLLRVVLQPIHEFRESQLRVEAAVAEDQRALLLVTAPNTRTPVAAVKVEEEPFAADVGAPSDADGGVAGQRAATGGEKGDQGGPALSVVKAVGIAGARVKKWKGRHPWKRARVSPVERVRGFISSYRRSNPTPAPANRGTMEVGGRAQDAAGKSPVVEDQAASLASQDAAGKSPVVEDQAASLASSVGNTTVETANAVLTSTGEGVAAAMVVKPLMNQSSIAEDLSLSSSASSMGLDGGAGMGGGKAAAPCLIDPGQEESPTVAADAEDGHTLQGVSLASSLAPFPPSDDGRPIAGAASVTSTLATGSGVVDASEALPPEGNLSAPASPSSTSSTSSRAAMPAAPISASAQATTPSPTGRIRRRWKPPEVDTWAKLARRGSRSWKSTRAAGVTAEDGKPVKVQDKASAEVLAPPSAVSDWAAPLLGLQVPMSIPPGASSSRRLEGGNTVVETSASVGVGKAESREVASMPQLKEQSNERVSDFLRDWVASAVPERKKLLLEKTALKWTRQWYPVALLANLPWGGRGDRSIMTFKVLGRKFVLSERTPGSRSELRWRCHEVEEGEDATAGVAEGRQSSSRPDVLLAEHSGLLWVWPDTSIDGLAIGALLRPPVIPAGGDRPSPTEAAGLFGVSALRRWRQRRSERNQEHWSGWGGAGMGGVYVERDLPCDYVEFVEGALSGMHGSAVLGGGLGSWGRRGSRRWGERVSVTRADQTGLEATFESETLPSTRVSFLFPCVIEWLLLPSSSSYVSNATLALGDGSTNSSPVPAGDTPSQRRRGRRLKGLVRPLAKVLWDRQGRKGAGK